MSKSSEEFKKRRNDTRRRSHDHPVGYGNINTNWQPNEIVLIYWQLNADEGNCVVDTNFSGVCSTSLISGAGPYPGIYSLAGAIANGAQIAVSSLPTNPDQDPQPWDFAVNTSCYVIFALKQPESWTSWYFNPSGPAIDFKQDETGWYADLYHVTANGPSNVAWGPCTVAYFSAYVDPAETPGTDPYTMNFQFWSGANLYVENFDPAIKNLGHTGLYRSGPHFPTHFKINRDRPPFDGRTKSILSNAFESQMKRLKRLSKQS
ncbi:MAG TPA: hypothetical protein VHX61_19175 [Rhizomicrobium sp.]|jgi:hypothetical protein|nr:hypothetical protein [Rhizomicrobium sp.]